MNLEQRELLAGLARLIEHELRILESLAHTAFRDEISGDHFRPFSIHHLRCRSRHPRYIKEGGRVEAEPGGKHQAFGECKAVEAEDQIDSELGPPSVADLADMKTLRKQPVEHRRGGCGNLWIATDQADAVALAHLLAGAGHRRLEKAQALRHPCTERRDAIGIAGRGANHDLTRRSGKQVTLNHLLDLVGVEDSEHDRLAFARDVGKRSCAGTDRGKPRVFLGIDVVADYGQTRREHAARIDFAHQA